MFLRSWLTFAVVIGVVQGVLALLAVLQHDAILSDLLRQRLAVIAHSTATSYKPILDLGMPISMMRGGDAIPARALEMDGEITAVHTFNQSGIIVHSSSRPAPQSVSPEVLSLLRLADRPVWGAETETEVVSGRTIVNRQGAAIGGVVVIYPRDRLVAASRAIVDRTLLTALAIWACFSAASYLILRAVLAVPRRALGRLETFQDADVAESSIGAKTATGAGTEEPAAGRTLLATEISGLVQNLARARRRFEEVSDALKQPEDSTGTNSPLANGSVPRAAADTSPADPSRSLARVLATRLAPPAAIVIAASALVLGMLILRDVNRSIEPELAARSNLVGVIVSDNVQRAVAAGAPLDNLVGAENYFGDMLDQLSEVAYVAVATGRIILEAGERIDPYLAPPRQRKDVRSHPIMLDGEEIAYVVIDIDPAFISRRFLDVFLDMSVVILVTVLISFEIMVLLTSRSLTAPFDRLQRLAAMQAAGDFSMAVTTRAGGAIGRLIRTLSSRAAQLHAAATAAGAGNLAALARLKSRFGLYGEKPASLRTSYFTDIRLALFMFAAADELPLAFLPLYTRSAENLWPWLDPSVLISLPLAGYLLAIVVASPFARSLTHRYGVRAMFLIAGLPLVGAHLGLYLAETAQEIVLWRTMTGVGYALVTLACQDYVLDTAPPEQRDRTLGVFTLVLFGGIFAGVALGGVLADRLGQHNVFLLSAGLIALSSALSAWLIAPGVGKGGGTTQRFSLRVIMAPVRSWRFVALAFGISIPGGLILQGFISYLVALTLDSLGASTADIGRALMLYFLGVMAAGPAGGRLAEAGVPVTLLALGGAALSGGSLTFYALWPGTSVLVGTVLATGIGYGLIRGAQVSLAMAITDTELAHFGSAAVLGSLRTLERVGSVLGLLVIAGIASAAGYEAAIGAVGLWTMTGAALFALVFFRVRQSRASG